MRIVRRYRFAIGILLLDLIMLLVKPELGMAVFRTTGANLKQMVQVLPAVFILLGLLDTWVPRQTVISMLGNRSGAGGAALSIFLGAAAAGPLYAAFPIASTMLTKGASLVNVFVFLGAWANLKIPMVTFEITSLGARFALTRGVLNIIGSIVIALIVRSLMSPRDVDEIYERQKRIQAGTSSGQKTADARARV